MGQGNEVELSMKGSLHRQSSVCYVCGQPGADTKDHLIPRSFFGGTLPSNTVTLKAHRRCHDKDGEDYLRFFLVIAATRSITADYLRRSKVARYAAKHHRLMRELHETIQSAERNAGGQLFVTDELGIAIHAKLMWPTLLRIARGLYFLVTGEILPSDVKIRIHNHILLPPHMQPVRWDAFTRKAGLSYEGVFDSWYYHNVDEAGVERWGFWLRFYREVTFLRVAKWDTNQAVGP